MEHDSHQHDQSAPRSLGSVVDLLENVSCVHEAFERQARRTPDRTAVVVGLTRLSYAEVDQRADGVARRLYEQGVRPGALVGVCVDRDEWLVPALLGVLKAGAAYVPLDRSYPVERTRFVVEDAGLDVIVASAGAAQVLPPTSTLVRVDDGAPTASLDLTVTGGDAAYVIYTSGSTGTPKGVVVEHRNVVNFLRWAARTFSPDEVRGVLAASSVCFDASVWEIFVPLVCGGTVILADNLLAAPSLAAWSEVTMMAVVPSALSVLLREQLPPNLRIVVTGGEAATRALYDRIYANPQVARVLNAYGPTECTVICVVAEVDRSGAGEPAIGQPIGGAELSVRDSDGRVLSDGEVGELWVAGAGVARGYLGRPETTAKSFGTFGYRTGDLVRREGGTYYFAGRVDDQVKIRGYRVELGEIEAVLASHPGVRHAVVLVDSDRLVGYVESDAVTEAELRAWLGSRVPEYMVPWRIAVLPAIPVAASGKADRAALPPITVGRDPDASYVAPRDETEQQVADVIAEVLGIAEVSVDDRFADLGGHSLAAARVVNELGRRRGTAVPLAEFLSHPTVEGLARALATLEPEPSLRRRPGLEHYPLTATQRELWFLRQLDPASPVTTLAIAIAVHGPVTASVLNHALTAIVRRHEVLRSVVVDDGEPHSVVRPPAPVPVDEVDLRGLPPLEQQEQLTEVRRAAAGYAFDLRRDVPLMRATMARLADEVAEVILVVDHFAFDGGAAMPFLRELATELAGEPVTGPPVQVGDVALHERELDAMPGRRERLDAYWRAELAGAVIPDDLPGRAEPPGHESVRLTIPLQRELVNRLQRFATASGTTPFAGYLAALGLVVGGLTGRADVVLGAAAVRRHRAGTEALLGPLVDVLPLRLRMAGGLTFRGLVRQCAATISAGLAHQELPASSLLGNLPTHRFTGASRTPVALSMLPIEEPATVTVGRIGLDLVTELGSGAAPTELTVYVARTATEVELQVEYSVRRFDRPDMEVFADRIIRILHTGLADPERPLSDFGLVTAQEHAALLALADGPALPEARPATLVEAILSQAALRPDAVAVSSPGGDLTYAELEAWSRRVAVGLVAVGVRPGDIVGVSLPRDHLLPAALLAVWRAGATYLPLDPEHPAERLAWMAADGGAGVVLTRGPAPAGLPGLDVDELATDQGARVLPAPDPEGLAYITYTSGSTGQPRGVETTHTNIASFVAGFSATQGLTAKDSVAVVAPLSFDMSAQEIWPTLSVGGRCVVVDRACARDGYALAERISDSGVTVVILTPSSLRMLLAAGWGGDPALRVFCGGEVMDAWLAGQLLDRVGELWNEYGPTEATVISTLHPVLAGAANPIPIGRPVAGARCYVMDPLGRAVPPGVVGELWIGGTGVARGYRGLPGASFVTDPYRSDARCYRSGDLVRWRADGTLEFHGRVDDQVKVRGQRIEPGEVAAQLKADPDVSDAVVVVARSDVDADLVGYLVPEHVDPAAVQARLRTRLPEHMVPRRWVTLPALPLLASGKVDRAALPQPSTTGGSRVSPNGDAEKLVATVWAEVLDRPQVWADDDFFALGGQSLAATRVVGRLRDALGVAIPVQALFDRPILADFAATIEQMVLEELRERSQGTGR
ncbi:amino acid adenylation domain-containing protein [Micromonospora sp. NPDC050417]|uniref:amino acid adenylation domain-containing protein n=1 Tax=Micromonospora sp. NPDC050417 TaxID=3364280 RepID=UPI003793BB85